MTIKISYNDLTTGQLLGEDFIVGAEIKALGTDMISSNPNVVFFDWHKNAIHEKARRCIDAVCQEALNDQTDTILTIQEKQDIVGLLAAEGKIISTVKQMPYSVKAEIVLKARIKSAAERKAE